MDMVAIHLSSEPSALASHDQATVFKVGSGCVAGYWRVTGEDGPRPRGNDMTPNLLRLLACTDTTSASRRIKEPQCCLYCSAVPGAGATASDDG